MSDARASRSALYGRTEGVAPGDRGDLRQRCERLRAAYAGSDGFELLRAAMEELRGRIALVSSFGAHSGVLLHMAARIDPEMPVLFLETGKLFPETLEYQRMLTRRLGLRCVREVRPAAAAVVATDPQGMLWQDDPDACCALRKVAPLDAALEGFDAWITGRKRYQGGQRSLLPAIEFSGGKIKVNPLAPWSTEQVSEYFRLHELPQHPLYRHGYLSIGCAPCTRRVVAGGAERDGRWAQQAKIECGIHRPSFEKDY